MDFFRDLRRSLIERKKRLFVNLETIGSFKTFEVTFDLKNLKNVAS